MFPSDPNNHKFESHISYSEFCKEHFFCFVHPLGGASAVFNKIWNLARQFSHSSLRACGVRDVIDPWLTTPEKQKQNFPSNLQQVTVEWVKPCAEKWLNEKGGIPHKLPLVHCCAFWSFYLEITTKVMPKYVIKFRCLQLGKTPEVKFQLYNEWEKTIFLKFWLQREKINLCHFPINNFKCWEISAVETYAFSSRNQAR